LWQRSEPALTQEATAGLDYLIESALLERRYKAKEKAMRPIARYL